MTEIGKLALSLNIEVFQASMILRGKFKFECILMACIIESNNYLVDNHWQNHVNYIFLNENIDDFTIQLVLARNYCCIRCEECLKSSKNFYPRIDDDFLKFVNTSCQSCAELKDKWACKMKIRSHLIILALKECEKIIIKLKGEYEIGTFLNEEHNIKEQRFMNSLDNTLGEELLETYIELGNLLRILVLKVFAHNLCENISQNEVFAFHHMQNKFLAVPCENSFYKTITEKDFIVCKYFEKDKNKYYIRLAAGYSYEEIETKAPRIFKAKSFKPKKQKFSLLRFPNVGEKFGKMLKINGGMYYDKIQNDLAQIIESFLIIYSENESCFKVLTKDTKAADCSTLIESSISNLFGLIKKSENVHHSVGDGYMSIFSLGFEIREIITPKNEIRYKITNLDSSVPSSFLIEKIKKTFPVKFISIQKVGNFSEALIYFSNQEEAENAKEILKLNPLQIYKVEKETPYEEYQINQANKLIFDIELLTDDAFKGKIVKVVILNFLTPLLALNLNSVHRVKILENYDR